MPFETAIETLLAVEGGFSDHAADSGGKTRFGITERVARQHGYEGDIRTLPLDYAKNIYRVSYWDELELDAVDHIDHQVADRLFDIGVNCGTARAAEWLQRALNVLNRGGVLFDDVVVDGDIGPATLGALREFIRIRGTDGALVLRRALNAMLGTHYITLAERREKDEAFVYGWLLRRLWLS